MSAKPIFRCPYCKKPYKNRMRWALHCSWCVGKPLAAATLEKDARDKK